MSNTSFYNTEELKTLGFKRIGKDILLSKKASIYNPEKIVLGSNLRIDDFCIISAGVGEIEIEDHVHIAPFCLISGSAKIHISKYSGLSSHCRIYSSSDDYTGGFMTNPTIPKELRNVISKPVLLGEHVIVGSGSIILPGVTLNIGCAIGANSMVNRDCDEFYIYHGNPIKKLNRRSREFLQIQKNRT